MRQASAIRAAPKWLGMTALTLALVTFGRLPPGHAESAEIPSRSRESDFYADQPLGPPTH